VNLFTQLVANLKQKSHPLNGMAFFVLKKEELFDNIS